jgi:hypothetical protein
VITDPAVITRILAHRARARGPLACPEVPEAVTRCRATAGSARSRTPPDQSARIERARVDNIRRSFTFFMRVVVTVFLARLV